MPTEYIELIQRGYAAHEVGDIAGVFAALHPEISVYQTELLPWGGDYRGHAEVGDFFRRINEHLDSHVELEEYISADDKVVVLGWIRGYVRANRKPFRLRIAHVWTVKEGLGYRFESYIDTPEMLRALANSA